MMDVKDIEQWAEEAAQHAVEWFHEHPEAYLDETIARAIRRAYQKGYEDGAKWLIPHDEGT